MSFYTSLSGLKNAQTSLNVISHNIANSQTVGFKKSTTAFADVVAISVLTNPSLTQGIGSTTQSITQNFSLGPIEQTGSALDLTVNGDGFFTLVSPTSGDTLFTRAGSFKVDGGGFVVNDQGNRLEVFPVDATGAVTSNTPQALLVPTANAAGSNFAGVTVTPDGSVVAAYADGSVNTIGKVALATFISPQGLKQLGFASWVSTGVSGGAVFTTPGTGGAGPILSGAVERSNVDLADELVGLITAQRYFQANSKAIDTASQIIENVINLRT